MNDYFNFILKKTISHNDLDEVKKIIMFFLHMKNSYLLKFDDDFCDLLCASDTEIAKIINELTGEF